MFAHFVAWFSASGGKISTSASIKCQWNFKIGWEPEMSLLVFIGVLSQAYLDAKKHFLHFFQQKTNYKSFST